MNVKEFFEKNKVLVIGGLAGVLACLIGLYFVYKFFISSATPTTVDISSANKLLPKNLINLGDTIKKDGLSLANTSFKDSEFMKRAIDYTTITPTSTVRGRDNPFLPYDFTGSSR
jgi:hypothetical protein